MGDLMKKITVLFLMSCCFSFNVSAQLIDVIAGSAIQGQVAAQSVAGTKKGLNMIQQNKLLAQLNLLITEIRTSSFGKYSNLNKQNFNYNFGSFDWDIGAINDDQFFIELKNIDKSSCNYLLNAVSEAVTVKINSFIKKDCDDLNSIQCIFN